MYLDNVADFLRLLCNFTFKPQKLLIVGFLDCFLFLLFLQDGKKMVVGFPYAFCFALVCKYAKCLFIYIFLCFSNQ